MGPATLDFCSLSQGTLCHIPGERSQAAFGEGLGVYYYRKSNTRSPGGAVFLCLFLKCCFPITVCHLVPSPSPGQMPVPWWMPALWLFILVGSAAALHSFEARRHLSTEPVCALGFGGFSDKP